MNSIPRVLLLGDSIRLSYQPFVAELLKDRAEVVGPDENCGTSNHTRAAIDDWLPALGRPDIVHWNNGLHDTGCRPNRDPLQYPLEVYLDNLKGILQKLRRTGAKIIWATTTPVPPGRPSGEEEWSWRPGDVDRYNEAAVRLMESEKVPVNDLNRIIAADLEAYLGEDMLHLNEAGKQACARAVAKAIEAFL